MIVLSHWMTKSFKAIRRPFVVTPLVCLFILSSCNPTEIASSAQQSGKSYSAAELVTRAYIYRESPAIIEGPKYGPTVSMKSSVDTNTPEVITTDSLLKSDCGLFLFNGYASVSDCIRAYDSKTASQQLLNRNADGTWIFPTNSSEFYQVNALYHVKLGVDTFFDKLKFAYDSLHTNPDFMWQTKSIPKYLPKTKMFWFKAITPTNDNYFKYDFLSTYALCNLELNANFQPAGPDLCFGKWSKHASFLFVQDPSIIYHELGHAFITVMMNFRNGSYDGSTSDFNDLRSNLNGRGYDEAGAIGEGVSDYFSFVMNKRTHLGEWALGKALNASRPMSEDDPLHISGIEPTSEGRLSYPQYVLYDPNEPAAPFEDVHYAGQIVSHYLVGLTKDLQLHCSLPTESAHETSTSYVMMLLAETFSELGDLNSIGIDPIDLSFFGMAHDPTSYVNRFNNLDEDGSYVWAHTVHPPTFRKFFQVMGKNIRKYMTYGLCETYTQDESEKLLDDYGLLLFKTYNDNGSSTKSKLTRHNEFGNIITVPEGTPPVQPNGVQEVNRRKTVLVSKQLLKMATPNTAKDVAAYYIIDDKANMEKLLASLLFKGFPMNPSAGIANTGYNNGNIKISPGEIVGIIPNLQNTSNSPMAGVHLLANDWDHVHITDTTGENGFFKPCKVDDVTTVAQGAEEAGTCDDPAMKTYKRHIKRQTSPLPATMKFSTTETVAPVCLVQLEENNATRWVSQNEFIKKQGLALQDKDCLGWSGNSPAEDFTYSPHECLVRVLPGSNSAFFSRIDAQKSYIESIRVPNVDYSANAGNVLIFEVNKWIPPGTKFRCRLRAKFSNCSDCFSDPKDSNNDGIPDSNDDYVDSEFNGDKPYKIINLEFDVND